MATFTAHQQQMMARALQLAEQGLWTVSPNPAVGCVITDQQGNIIGEGWHQRAGTPHAEVHALAMAGDAAKGAIAYVTLEPCSHYGRTPPCAEGLIKAGVSEVICAMQDPNPLVAGKGLRMLQDAGIKTQSGLLEAQANHLNRGFIKRMVNQRPFVTVKLACGLDGKTAMANGHSKWITSAAARKDVQQFRAQSCAILTGADTVLADNPSMNVRYNELSHKPAHIDQQSLRQPLRVVIDGDNRLSADLTIFNQPIPVLLVNKSFNKAVGESEYVKQWQAPLAQNNKIDLDALLIKLGEMNINNLWLEAGASLAGAIIDTKLADELIVYQAPKLMGHSAKSLLNLPEFEHMQQAIELQYLDVRMVGHDIRIIAVPQYQ
ncbi:bifunctional diaminohydroxyphosphoribosylaminopyrimidine deaminase/5-amino-6-(5-phosphoribosylamino)uracil reductase RibD [Neptunicella marina]|uniref:Riboflavin biosynthesis protein RibD n=1 Tax=Neptunicella marina TaxID=2125989 RepID=A0A8J6IQ22_9ALTE|nr:bifunctional diaminohydroxyphosphoribosylaminopyrimidine deaminase/5-amino-6-(5-phosphoribosylamino)uracil reductase RibD [Neptunicella marina]MBC3764554.1 bifunctional diaminohydroxyphosphoribosylaminopyrimidine deaminase/5-amino-6-(5-phosphoribosylamino)uracil reductase RibD [Neptunicella marina]